MFGRETGGVPTETEPSSLRAARAHDVERRCAQPRATGRPLRSPRLRRTRGHRSRVARVPRDSRRELRRLSRRGRGGSGAREAALRPARAAGPRADLRRSRPGRVCARGRRRSALVRRRRRGRRADVACRTRARGGACRRPPVLHSPTQRRRSGERHASRSIASSSSPLVDRLRALQPRDALRLGRRCGAADRRERRLPPTRASRRLEDDAPVPERARRRSIEYLRSKRPTYLVRLDARPQLRAA